ncbi:bile acid:sodium symporter [Pontibacter sp. JAM-7]|uniref:bile acid:sodium symporter n=1 Tax=Pontibacter sp. JAM-7 TaxID=3366581 RepID=UPI003AF9B4E4
MQSLYLPVGLVLSFIVAWWLPEPGGQLKDLGLIPWMVVTIFLVNGYQTNLKELPKDRQFLYALGAAGIIALFIAPLIGLGVTQLLALPAGLALGILVKAAVPPTLSTCIVMTQLSHGYPLWALIITVVLNLVGVFTLPFMLGLTLDSQGSLEIDPLPLLQSLVLLVLLPFLAGLALRRLLSFNPGHAILRYLPSTCIIVTVWMALSSSHEIFQALELKVLWQIAVATWLIHFSLMLLAFIASRLLGLDPRARIAMLFTVSQKTLPVAISVLAALDLNVPIGEAILACVLFHFLMLFTDSLLEPRLRLAPISQ